jgi:hypothetical protein
MLIKNRLPRGDRRLIKLGARIICLIVLATVGGYLNNPNTAHAIERFSCVLTVGYGQVTILSCGSSAGNFIYTCSRTDPGVCEIAPASNDEVANMNCTQYAQEGCPETQYGDEPLTVQDAR